MPQPLSVLFPFPPVLMAVPARSFCREVRP